MDETRTDPMVFEVYGRVEDQPDEAEGYLRRAALRVGLMLREVVELSNRDPAVEEMVRDLFKLAERNHRRIDPKKIAVIPHDAGLLVRVITFERDDKEPG